MLKGLRWGLLFGLLLGLVLFFSFDLGRYMSFEWLQAHHIKIQAWIQTHLFVAIAAALGVYIISVTFSIPGATFLTLSMGYLFGLWLGSVIVLIGATLGSACIFLIVQSTLGRWLAKKATGWVKELRTGFKKNAFSYLLFLRLVPLFPFWVLNIVPALLGMKLSTFMLATFLGIIPGTVVYIAVGQGLETVLSQQETPNLGIIFDPNVFLPLLGLGILALLPVFFKSWFKKR